MSHFLISIRKAFAALALVLVMFLPKLAVAADKCGSVRRLMTALSLTNILYPELEGKEVSISLSGGHGSPLNTPTEAVHVGIEIDRPRWLSAINRGIEPDSVPPSAGTGSDELELPSYLDFDFAEGTGTAEIHVVCRPLKFINNKSSKQIQGAREVIDSHPEWTDEQDLDAATKLGMRFGPTKKNDVLQLIPLKELSAFYGPLRIQKAFFSITYTKQPRSNFADLTWFITVDRVGTQKTLQIMVEPFRGKIVAISE